MSLAATRFPFSLSLGPSADRFDHFLDELPQRGRWMAIAHVPIADRTAGRVMFDGLGQPLPFAFGRRHQNRTQAERNEDTCF
jgi:hypothetical protein